MLFVMGCQIHSGEAPLYPQNEKRMRKKGELVKKCNRRLSLFLCIVVLLSIVVIPKSAQAVAYTDVSSSSWYYEAVCYVTDNGLFNGTGNGQFSPNLDMSRGMFVAALGRLASVDPDDIVSAGTVSASDVNFRSGPSTSYSSHGRLSKGTYLAILGSSEESDGLWYQAVCQGVTGYIRSDFVSLGGFWDVSSSMYYTDYITWAAAMGIVSGYADGSFLPDASITRQEMCVILYNYCQIMDIKIPSNNSNVQFGDQNNISYWASDAVKALHRAGVINGYDDGNFYPGNSSSRAQVAQVMMNFDKICIQELLDGILVDCDGYLNMREGPGTEYAVITQLPSGAMAKLLGAQGVWYYVTYNGYTGYVHSDYCTLTTYVEPNENPSELRQEIISFAKTLIGIPYVWGGNSPSEGFDCSGFVKYVFDHFSISLPRVAEQQYNYCTRIEKSQLKAGDLVFFSSSSSNGIEHVGIYIGNSDGYTDAFIHASSSKGVIVSSLSQDYYTTYFYGCGRVIND
jgi:cell wall-associated NlpC family hydrolase